VHSRSDGCWSMSTLPPLLAERSISRRRERCAESETTRGVPLWVSKCRPLSQVLCARSALCGAEAAVPCV